MKRFVITLFVCICTLALAAQETDPFSTPPGAPMRKLPVDRANRILPNHPGNAGNKVTASHFTIIESSTSFPGHNMDLVWQGLLAGMGHTSNILQQTGLDNNAFFAGSNALIVSSGVLNLSPARINTIQQFLQTGKSVYLQGEYLPTYNTNQAFAAIVGATGGTFNTGATVAGDLIPCSILGSLATTTNSVPSINYHWYGCTATGCNNVGYFMNYSGNNIGYVYCPINGAFGDMIQSSDQDWVNQSQSLPLMQNIVFHLLSGSACSIVCGVLDATEIDLQASRNNDGTVALDWITNGELTDGSFQVFANGLEIGGFDLDGGSDMHFQWQDQRLPSGLQHYEVRFRDMNGQTQLSGETHIDLGPAAPRLSLANVEGGFRIFLSEGLECQSLSLIDPSGRRQALPFAEVQAPQGQLLNMDGIAAGVYWIQAKTVSGQLLQAKCVWME